MTDRIRRIVVLALVWGLVAQSVVAPVAASPDGDGSDWGSSAECAARGIMSLSPFSLVENCQTPNQNRAENHADIYTGGLAAYDIGDDVLVVQNNHLQDARDASWCVAKAEAIEQMQNGSNKSTTLNAVNETVDEHYAGIQKNLLTTWNSTAIYSYYLIDVARQSGLQGSYDSDTGVIFVDTESSTGGGQYEADRIPDPTRTPNLTRNVSVTLANGNTTQYTRLGHIEDTYSWMLDPFNSSDSGLVRYRHDELWVANPEDGNTETDYDSGPQYLIQENRWESAWLATQDNHDYLRNNTQAFVDGLYQTYNASDFDSIDAQEVHSACSMTTYASDLQSTGYYAHARAQFALNGINGSVDESFAVRYDPFDESGDYRATTVANITFETNGTGHGAHVTPSETIVVDASSSSGTVEGVTVDVSSLNGSALGSVTASQVVVNGSTIESWSFNLSSVNDSIKDGERVSLNVTANASDGEGSVSNYEVVVDGPTGRDGERLSGAVMTDWRPSSTNGSLVTDHVYNTSNAGPPVYFLDQRTSDRTVTVTMDGEFVITSMTNLQTQESVNETTLEEQNHQTANGSLTLEEIKQVLEWREEHTKTYEASGTSGDGDSGSGSAWWEQFVPPWLETLGIGLSVGLLAVGLLGFALLKAILTA